MPWPIFPICPSYGFTKAANYSVTIVEKGSGVRSRNRNWYYPLHIFSAVPIDNRTDDDMYRIARFWHAIGGMAGSFLFKDYTDFNSTNTPSTAVTRLDQPVVETEDGNFQLVKLYEDDEFMFQQQRIIQKPKQGSILVADAGTLLTEGVDYSLDYDTGLLTLNSSLPVGTPTWGGDFYVPVMFESTPEFVRGNWKIQSTGFALRELRLSSPTLIASS
jgi:uncharacterized protein (TIGR02217 family)